MKNYNIQLTAIEKAIIELVLILTNRNDLDKDSKERIEKIIYKLENAKPCQT